MAVSSRQDEKGHDTMSVEPVGIVISRGTREEPTPVFWAYVWGPAPETESTSSPEPKAA